MVEKRKRFSIVNEDGEVVAQCGSLLGAARIMNRANTSPLTEREIREALESGIMSIALIIAGEMELYTVVNTADLEEVKFEEAWKAASESGS